MTNSSGGSSYRLHRGVYKFGVSDKTRYKDVYLLLSPCATYLRMLDRMLMPRLLPHDRPCVFLWCPSIASDEKEQQYIEQRTPYRSVDLEGCW